MKMNSYQEPYDMKVSCTVFEKKELRNPESPTQFVAFLLVTWKVAKIESIAGIQDLLTAKYNYTQD